MRSWENSETTRDPVTVQQAPSRILANSRMRLCRKKERHGGVCPTTKKDWQRHHQQVDRRRFVAEEDVIQLLQLQMQLRPSPAPTLPFAYDHNVPVSSSKKDTISSLAAAPALVSSRNETRSHPASTKQAPPARGAASMTLVRADRFKFEREPVWASLDDFSTWIHIPFSLRFTRSTEHWWTMTTLERRYHGYRASSGDIESLRMREIDQKWRHRHGRSRRSESYLSRHPVSSATRCSERRRYRLRIGGVFLASLLCMSVIEASSDVGKRPPPPPPPPLSITSATQRNPPPPRPPPPRVSAPVQSTENLVANSRPPLPPRRQEAPKIETESRLEVEKNSVLPLPRDELAQQQQQQQQQQPSMSTPIERHPRYSEQAAQQGTSLPNSGPQSTVRPPVRQAPVYQHQQQPLPHRSPTTTASTSRAGRGFMAPGTLQRLWRGIERGLDNLADIEDVVTGTAQRLYETTVDAIPRRASPEDVAFTDPTVKLALKGRKIRPADRATEDEGPALSFQKMARYEAALSKRETDASGPVAHEAAVRKTLPWNDVASSSNGIRTNGGASTDRQPWSASPRTTGHPVSKQSEPRPIERFPVLDRPHGDEPSVESRPP